MGWYNFPDGSLSNVAATDCDTGYGSSGAQAYLGNKVFGIIDGHFDKLPDGAELDVKKHATFITCFDGRIYNYI
ncbi:hypothetical protein, partial [Mesorhizobium sp. M2A.F.Ca.ET.039.01.1.1]|uniref:hypothetical protein n=1 Tax=Mesorhizobium sp. M2A.F.Ca.ET.039.01.1.1 TaxID=2496746 RepID=UPI001AECAB1F